MLDERVGSLRPWELEQFTPHEERLVHLYKQQLDQSAAEGV